MLSVHSHLLVILLSGAVAAAPALAQSANALDSAGVEAWRSDLEFLRKEMPAHHANLFHSMSRAEFDSALNSIEARLPSLSRSEVIVELEKLDALIGDAHSSVGPWRDSVIGFHSLPVAFYWFAEGMMIHAADSANGDLIGSRVIAIGGIAVDTAIARVRPLISHDNEMGIRAYAPFLLAMPEVLEAIGLARDAGHVQLTVAKNGKRRTVSLSPAGLFPMLAGDADKSWNKRAGWIDARDAASSPLWLSDTNNMYWYRYLPAEKTLYVQINTIQQKASDSLSAFMRRAIAAADSARAQKLVLDLRLNGGGNGDFNKRIFLPIIKSRYDSAGKFFVITGRRTFSAAQMLVTEIQKYTNAIFVGEPTASHGNHFGDSYKIVLPNSRVTVRVSTLWHQYLDSRDKRLMIEPAIPAPLSFADYAAGRDTALEAIFGASPPRP
jgi:hypothetical protein